MLCFPRLQHIAMLVCIQKLSKSVVDLDHGGAEVGEELRAERTGHRQSQVEHDDAFERRRDPAPGAGRARRGWRRRRRRLGPHRRGVRSGSATPPIAAPASSSNW